jgi:hydroxyacylglutathione hydrolase
MVEALLCNIKKKSTIYRFISSLFGVCSYFIVEKEQVIIIDPGKLDNNVFEWLCKFENIRKIVYITHEHFDHHYHANKIFKLKKTFFFSPSESFNFAIKDTRKNLSHFYNDPVETVPKSNLLESYLKVIKTPGHSKESYCFTYDNVVFGGDTLIDKKYLVLKLPGSNKKDFNDSIDNLKLDINLNSIVMPGHGEFFIWEKE